MASHLFEVVKVHLHRLQLSGVEACQHFPGILLNDYYFLLSLFPCHTPSPVLLPVAPPPLDVEHLVHHLLDLPYTEFICSILVFGALSPPILKPARTLPLEKVSSDPFSLE